MKVARKTLRKRTASAPSRATLTLTADAYAKIDELRGEASRSAWVQELIEQEAERREHEQFVSLVREQYTPAVCRQTLAVNDEFPVHES
jgi:predicted CopG family antitoxin